MYRRILHRRYQRKRFVLLLLFLLLVVAGTLWYSRDHFLKQLRPDPRSYDDIIRDAAHRHNIDPLLVKAVIWNESEFDANAVGSKGEVGLMQLLPSACVVDWAKAHGLPKPTLAQLFDPRLNVEIGTWYLARAMRHWREYKHGDELALCQYNAGRSNALKWKPRQLDGPVTSEITFPSTKAYVTNIMDKYREYASRRVAE